MGLERSNLFKNTGEYRLYRRKCRQNILKCSWWKIHSAGIKKINKYKCPAPLRIKINPHNGYFRVAGCIRLCHSIF